ncbi:MAG: hypothetical protein KDA81_23030, partial [Planctomycetaceae bacterium]|nr:hypothetical protein [Planctomycetaceae bacterium]
SLIQELRELQHDRIHIGHLRSVLRKLQRYSVSIFPKIYQSLLGSDIELLDSGHAILINESCYDQQLGFRPDQQGFHEPHSLIV